MSRSYKKPYITDQQNSPNSCKKYKRLANKAVRKSEEVSKGNQYKKEYCSWNIRDYSFECPKKDMKIPEKRYKYVRK